MTLGKEPAGHATLQVQEPSAARIPIPIVAWPGVAEMRPPAGAAAIVPLLATAVEPGRPIALPLPPGNSLKGAPWKSMGTTSCPETYMKLTATGAPRPAAATKPLKSKLVRVMALN